MKISFERRRLVLIAVLGLAVLPYFINLGSSSLWDSNEAFYAETPREMIEAGDYVNPAFNYQPRFNKPPLVYWVVALSYKALGVSEAAERLPIALGALVLIASALYLGRAACSTNAGLIAAIALASTPRFLMFSRRIVIDVFLAMFLNLALLMFALSRRSPEWRKFCLVLMYVFIALGVLTKGPVAVLLPGAAIGIYLAVDRRLGVVRELMLGPGLLIVLAIVSPWYVAIYSEHGWHYIKSFLLDDNISRYTQPVWGPRRSLFFYIPVLAGDLLPWSLFLPGAIWGALRFRKGAKVLAGQAGGPTGSSSAPPSAALRAQSVGDSNSGVGILLLIWIAVVVLFFSLSRNKEDLYILPVYPAAAALIGGVLSRLLGEGERGKLWIPLGIAALFIAAVGGTLLYLRSRLSIYELAGAEIAGYLALTGGLLAAVSLLVRKHRLAFILIAITFVCINWVFVLRILPSFEKYRPVRALCEVIESEERPDARVGYYRTASPSMVFYLRRPIFEYYRPEQLSELFTKGEEVYCVMSAEDYEEAKEWLPRTIVLARRPSFQVKLRTILDAKETPQVLLITNNLGAKTRE